MIQIHFNRKSFHIQLVYSMSALDDAHINNAAVLVQTIGSVVTIRQVQSDI